jgi:hypothetical protein
MPQSSMYMELVPLVAAFEAFGSGWRGQLVIVGTDNLGNVFAINSATAAGLGGRAAIRKIRSLYALAEAHGFEFVAMWVPRELNTTADAMSKSLTIGAASAAVRAAHPSCSCTVIESTDS